MHGSSILGDIAETASLVVDTLASSVRSFAAACIDIRFDDPAARVATTAMIAVVTAILIADAMHLEDPWWAAISAYVSTQRTGPDSIKRGVLRILGTVVGAALGVIALAWVAYDMFACCLVIFVIATISIIGFNVSRYAYGWLLIVLTFGLVALPSLDAPAGAPMLAVARVLEVIVGTVTAVAIAVVLEPAPALPAPVELGWSGLFGPRLYITLHAMRWASAVAMLPVLWRLLGLTGMSQMAVTLVAVLATPIATDLHDTNRQILVKGLQRLLGCAIGGTIGLALIGFGFDAVLPWLVTLAIPLWWFAYIQNGTHPATYVGAQGGFVLVLTLVQGHGPPLTLNPGVDRLVGIFCGLLGVMLMVLLTNPASTLRRPADGS